MPQEILVFDFVSHANMHLMFNEGYLRMVQAAYPDDHIRFHACEGHCQTLKQRLGDGNKLTFHVVPGYVAPKARHAFDFFNEERNAAPCVRVMTDAVRDRNVRLVALLGADAPLHAQCRKQWPLTSGIYLHILLHGQLGASFIWRSRNPIMRMQDMHAQFNQKHAHNIRLVALEHGIADQIRQYFPKVRENVETLEHPILTEEWSENTGQESVRLGFLGSIRSGKGFEAFCDTAERVVNPGIEFDVVGHLSQPELMMGRKLPFVVETEQLDRATYLQKLEALSFVCLLLEGRAYDYTASGTLADAIAALKPIIAIRNAALTAIFEKYGPIGNLFDTVDDIVAYLNSVDLPALQEQQKDWLQNLRAIREARASENLAIGYHSLCADTK